MDQFGDTILFTTDDEILEAMSRNDETFLCESEDPEVLVHEEELLRPQTADGEGEERPFTQAGFREEDLAVSVGFFTSGNRLRANCKCFLNIGAILQPIKPKSCVCFLLVETSP